MSSINSLSTGQYYQLPTDTSGDTSVTAPAISTGSGSGSSSELAALLNGDSDSVDLSPQAQSILDAINGTSSSSGMSSLAGLSSANSSFELSYAQQQKIGEILSKYADSPLTQSTFDSIQSDLAAAGLSPSQLSQMDSLQSFDSTQIFLDALNGKTDPVSTPDDSTEQAKSSNYMQQIYTEWKGMNTASSGSGAAGSASGASV